MIKQFWNSFLLLLFLYNNMRVAHSQYKSFLHSTINLLDPDYQRGQVEPNLAARLRKFDLIHLYKQLIREALDGEIQNKSSEQKRAAHSGSARDFQHNINKRQDVSETQGRKFPIERKLHRVKPNTTERVVTSTHGNKEDAYYVTNIESTNIDQADKKIHSRAGSEGKFDPETLHAQTNMEQTQVYPGRMNGKIANVGLSRKFDTADINSLKQSGSLGEAKEDLINKNTIYNHLVEVMDKVNKDESENKDNEIDPSLNGAEERRENLNSNARERFEDSLKNAHEHEMSGESKGQNMRNNQMPPNQTSSASSSETWKNQFTMDDNILIVKNILMKRCQNQYSFYCLKLDLMKIIEKLNTADQITLLPGVQIVRHTNTSTAPVDVPISLVLAILRNNTSPSDSLRLDEVLLKKLRSYLSQLSLNIRLLDTESAGSQPTAIAESTGRTFFSDSWKNTLSNFIGRGKKQNYGHAALWSAATLAALAFASLAALSTKALITAIIALILAAMSAFKGHHGHGYGNYGYDKTSHYEIITKPAHYHDHDHIHSANLAAAASPYASYARQLVNDPMLPLAFDPEEPYGPHEE